ncbi:hypothetical protein [Maribacter sp. 2-571]|uniref:hypothetical protein n=1 Tax=Maribacter sp. 2-571 TaxID=3417569 RepID=UPI003D3549E5
MKKFTLSVILGFIVNNVVATLVALFVLNPLLNPMFKGTLRTAEDGLEMPSLLSGYFMLTVLMVIGYKYFALDARWIKKGIGWGLLIGGATFLAGHLIIAGWAAIPPKPMFISGILDILATVATGITIAYIYRNE